MRNQAGCANLMLKLTNHLIVDIIGLIDVTNLIGAYSDISITGEHSRNL